MRSAQIRAYRLLLDNAQAMLTAALEERWDDLTTLQANRQDCMFEVRKADQAAMRGPLEEEVTLLTLAVLECDGQTSQLVKNYQTDMLSTFDTSRKLANAYRSV